MTNENSPIPTRGMVFWAVLLLTVLPITEIFAQEIMEPVELTEADWTKFATVEVMTADFVAKKTKELKAWVRSKQEFGGGARFNEIKAVWGDVEKETLIYITTEEKIAYRVFLEQQASLQKAVLTYQVDLIRDEKLLGTELYQRIAGLIADDPTLKEKLDQEISRLKKKRKR